ncbi:MAG: penicillin-binding protein 2 [Firmicutes bacterium]|jgi:cell division protein FtsI/penicillin-binding protein 2|nr:penicillin-binding protein 2 [Bacillota bacterium]
MKETATSALYRSNNTVSTGRRDRYAAVSSLNRTPGSKRGKANKTSSDNRRVSKRVLPDARLVKYRALTLLTMLLIGAIFAALLTEQVVFSSSSNTSIAAEIRSSEVLPASRGTIYDRNGNILFDSVESANVYTDDYLSFSITSEATQLSSLLKESKSVLLKKLHQPSGYVLLASDVSLALKQKLASFGFPNIYFEPSEVYKNPSGNLFQPLLGGINYSGGGDAGLQYLYNSLLDAHSGYAHDEQLGAGVLLPNTAKMTSSPKDGQSLVLSLDENLQEKVTEDLSKQILATHATSGVAIFTDVKTGAILAMVDLIRTKSNKVEPASSNLALTSVYEPGSVMKIATFSFALKDHIITPNTTLSVPYSIQIGGYTFEDAEYHPTQIMPAKEILAQSSNVGTIKIASLLGPQRLYQAFKKLGFGQFTGLNWPGESPGILGSPATWYGSDLGSLPIGLGEAVTPMQLLDAYNTVADGGVFRTPHILDGVVNGNHVKYLPVPKGKRILPESVASTLTKMFEGVIQNGTGIAGCVPGYLVAGKTGTAQVPSRTSAGYIPGDWNATFVGYAPAQNPVISGIVFLHHSNPIYGGAASAPVFSEVMRYALAHYGIRPPKGNYGSGQGLCSPQGALLARESGLVLGQ